MTTFFPLILTFALLFIGPTMTEARSDPTTGVWSAEAVPASYANGIRKMEIPAPDKQKIARIEGTTLHVTVNGHPLPMTNDIGVEPVAELAWAPDSSGFFITESDGGLVGSWQVSVFLVGKTLIQKANVTQEVERQFKKTYTCKESEEPNVAGIGWLKGSQQLLVVAEVPPHSSYQDMGKIMGYVISTSNGEILMELRQGELSAHWEPYLGSRLKK